MAAAAVFFGFHFFFGEAAPTDPTTPSGNETDEYLEELTYYRERSEQLETELSSSSRSSIPQTRHTRIAFPSWSFCSRQRKRRKSRR